MSKKSMPVKNKVKIKRNVVFGKSISYEMILEGVKYPELYELVEKFFKNAKDGESR